MSIRCSAWSSIELENLSIRSPLSLVAEGARVDEATVVLDQDVRVGREEVGDEEAAGAQAARDGGERGDLVLLRLQVQE